MLAVDLKLPLAPTMRSRYLQIARQLRQNQQPGWFDALRRASTLSVGEGSEAYKEALLELGEYLLRDKHIPENSKNVEEGVALLSRAAELGNAPAINLLGQHFFKRGQFAKAYEMLHDKDPQPMDLTSRGMLAWMCLSGVKEDMSKAKALLQSIDKAPASELPAHSECRKNCRTLLDALRSDSNADALAAAAELLAAPRGSFLVPGVPLRNPSLAVIYLKCSVRERSQVGRQRMSRVLDAASSADRKLADNPMVRLSLFTLY